MINPRRENPEVRSAQSSQLEEGQPCVGESKNRTVERREEGAFSKEREDFVSLRSLLPGESLTISAGSFTGDRRDDFLGETRRRIRLMDHLSPGHRLHDAPVQVR